MVRSQLLWIALLLAWLGLWGAWIPHYVASLRLNAVDLAEWATFLTEVRTGPLHFIPDVLRFGVALTAVALAWGAGHISRPTLRWVVRFLAILPGVLLIPPYPYFLQLWWSESYGLRFVAAGLVFLGVAATLGSARIPHRVGHGILLILTVLAGVLSVWSFAVLLPAFATHYGESLGPGWGIVLVVLGLLLAVVLEGAHFIWRQPLGHSAQPLADASGK